MELCRAWSAVGLLGLHDWWVAEPLAQARTAAVNDAAILPIRIPPKRRNEVVFLCRGVQHMQYMYQQLDTCKQWKVQITATNLGVGITSAACPQITVNHTSVANLEWTHFGSSSVQVYGCIQKDSVKYITTYKHIFQCKYMPPSKKWGVFTHRFCELVGWLPFQKVPNIISRQVNESVEQLA